MKRRFFATSGFSFLAGILARPIPIRAAIVTPSRPVVGDRLVGTPGSLVVYLPRLPVSNSLALYLNGMRLTPGVDYTQSGVAITLIPYYSTLEEGLESPKTVLVADYWAA